MRTAPKRLNRFTLVCSAFNESTEFVGAGAGSGSGSIKLVRNVPLRN